MKISVVILATNPLTNNYQVFFPCVESWSHLADEIIVVDGGMTDSSYEILSKRVQDYRIVSNPLTTWPVQRPFHSLQFAVNLNEGLTTATGDWIIRADADYVMNRAKSSALRGFLSKNISQPILSFTRFKVDIARKNRVEDRRGFILNRAMLNKPGGLPRLRFGASSKHSGIVSDLPLQNLEKSIYIHPYTGAKVEIYRGFPLLPVGSVPPELLNCCVFDHFFYTPKQVEEQGVLFFEYYTSRQIGSAPMGRREVHRLKKLDTIIGFVSLRDVKDCELLPRAFLDQVACWWRDDCYGAAIHQHVSECFCRITKQSYRCLRKVQSEFLQAVGYKGLFKMHTWFPIETEGIPALDVHLAWADQDHRLSKIGFLKHSEHKRIYNSGETGRLI